MKTLFLTLLLSCASALHAQMGYYYDASFVSFEADGTDNIYVIINDKSSAGYAMAMASDKFSSYGHGFFTTDGAVEGIDVDYVSRVYDGYQDGKPIGKAVVLPEIVLSLKSGYDISSVLQAYPEKLQITKISPVAIELNCQVGTAEEVMEMVAGIHAMAGINWVEPNMYTEIQLTDIHDSACQPAHVPTPTYDLQGRRVGSSKFTVQSSQFTVYSLQLRKGIYIRDGRKMVVR